MESRPYTSAFARTPKYDDYISFSNVCKQSDEIFRCSLGVSENGAIVHAVFSRFFALKRAH